MWPGPGSVDLISESSAQMPAIEMKFSGAYGLPLIIMYPRSLAMLYLEGGGEWPTADCFFS